MPELTLTARQDRTLEKVRPAKKVVLFGHPLVEIQQFTERLVTDGIGLKDLQPEEAVQILRKYADEDLANDNLKVAGDVINAATYLNRLPGPKVETVYAGVVGSGELGKRVTAIIEDRGIRVMPYVNDTDCPVGIYGIEKTVINGEIDNQPHYDRKESERDLLSDPTKVDLIVAAAREKGVFYTSLIPLGMARNFSDFENLLARIREAGIPIMFDTNYRKYVMEECFSEQSKLTPGEAFRKISPYINLLSSGREDMHRLFPALKGAEPKDILPFLHKIHSADTIIALKSGGNGTFALNHENAVCKIPTPNVQVSDTTGGGDSWNAKFIHSIRNRKSFPTAIENASKFASIIVQRTGAVISQAEINEIFS